MTPLWLSAVQELGWVLIIVGGPMLLAALWVLYDESGWPGILRAWAQRRRRNAAVRKLRREGRLTPDAVESIRRGEWL